VCSLWSPSAETADENIRLLQKHPMNFDGF
jgi:hypothetical protein